jgi:hypothetical protein
MKYGARYIVGLAALAAAAFALAGDLHIEITPAYEGDLTQTARTPMKVTVTNDGPATSGTVRLETQAFHMDYPVSLPARDSVEFEAYVYLSWGDVVASLATPRGHDSTRFQIGGYSYAAYQPGVLLVGLSPGSLSYLRTTSNGSGTNSFADLYCPASDLPTRPIGYEGLSAVVLDPSIRALSPEQVRALQLYVVSGGTLVFNGGKSADWDEASWATSLLPARGFKAGPTVKFAFPHANGQGPFPSVSLTTAKPVDGARANYVRGDLVAIVKPIGLGRSLYYTFDLSESQVARWPGMEAYIQSQHWSNAMTRVASFQQSPQQGMGVQPAIATAPQTLPSAASPDPFSAKLPSTSFIFELLASYFVVVVPLNFLVLKRMKRGEWAWFTAPVLSLAFAGLLFHSARGLYSAKMSQATRGILVTQEGIPDAEFVGATQMFIPNAGEYDLHLKDVDSVGIAGTDSGVQQIDIGANPELRASDSGSVSATKMIARNLSFRELTFAQIYPAGSWVRFHVDRKGDQARVTVTNASPYAISHAWLLVGNLSVGMGDLAAGAQRTVTANLKKSGPALQTVSLPMVNSGSARIALDGEVDGLEPGPRIGKEVATRRSIELLAFANTEVKQ